MESLRPCEVSGVRDWAPLSPSAECAVMGVLGVLCGSRCPADVGGSPLTQLLIQGSISLLLAGPWANSV